MTCTWNKIFQKNSELFKDRFPELFSILEPHFINIQKLLDEAVLSQKDSLDILNSIYSFWQFSFAKSGDLTVKENGISLHSAYNPQKEAERLFGQNDSGSQCILFAGIGLGYNLIEGAKKNPSSLIAVIEPDPGYLFASMSVIDWSAFFSLEKCIIFTQVQMQQIFPVLERFCSIDKIKVITQNAQTKHQENWFKDFFTLLERNRQKEEINTNTLERFSSLWLKNSSKNLKHFQGAQGITIYKNILQNQIPALIIAAGPSLEDILPYLAELKKKMVIISVDTALRTLLRHNIQPDFVLLIDPQYYAACHVLGLNFPESVLITESSVYPSVMNVNCRKKIFIESMFPLGRFFETNLLEGKTFGKITAGGSVSTSCWDFAKYIGANEIYVSGLDLGYPDKKTHIKGSTFEEKSHSISTKLKPAENNLCSILFSASNEKGKDFSGRTLITDSKMKLFAWWFESQIAKENEKIAKGEKGIKTFTLSEKSLFIPGMEKCKIDTLLKLDDISEKKEGVIKNAENCASCITTQEFNSIYDELMTKFEQLLEKAKKGLSICKKILQESSSIAEQKAQQHFKELSEIDNFILTSDAKTVASLVFPTQRQLDSLLKQERIEQSPVLSNIIRSKVIYSELVKAITKYKKNLDS